MNDAIAHRGPDGEGYYLNASVGLAHRRLAILDLRPEGDQPMHYSERYVIVFNGEIYNYVELRSELREAGYKFSTTTDTEVILAAYDNWGQQCVERFNGMWAFALYDVERRQLFCSRDRFGIKPFYYRMIGDQQLLLGSEIKQVLPAEPKANRERVLDYLLTAMLDHTDETLFEEVMKLPASHNMIVDLETGTVEFSRYYELTVDTKLENLSQADTGKKASRAIRRVHSLSVTLRCTRRYMPQRGN